MPGIQDKKLPGGSKSAKKLFEYAILIFFQLYMEKPSVSVKLLKTCVNPEGPKRQH